MFLSRLKAFTRLSTVRQTLWLLSLFAVISALAWGGTFWLVSRELERAVDDRLRFRMDAVLTALAEGQPLPEPEPGQTIGPAPGRWRDGFQTLDVGQRSTEFRYLVFATSEGRLAVGENTERQEEMRDILAGGLQVTLLATVFASVAFGLWLARRGQARMTAIGEGLSRVAAGDLGARIALDGPQDDLSDLATQINATTARLETAMTQMRVQSSNIAHDLRTPLARLRAQLELTLLSLSDQGRAVTEDDLTTALDQIDHLTGTFDALLRLARLESGAGREGFTPVPLADVAGRVVETFGPVVEDAGQHLLYSETSPSTVSGDANLLLQMLANLIQNALRYGAQGQSIRLSVDGRTVSLVDEGPGIPEGLRAQVLEPLYQGESTRQGDGFGLGLSIVRAICDLHGAKLLLSDGPGERGLSVSIQFPPDLKADT